MLTVIEAVKCVSKGYPDLVQYTAGVRWEQFCPCKGLEEEKTQKSCAETGNF